ncbi:MAG: hypothetical protein IKO55_18920 [Kiritimatiellae bacterium]|nr:hypothetical protein [Kiritimatiellia bacterium]
MALDINGYNDTFRAFTDFAKVMTQSKGGMNSIARVDGGVDITTGALAGRTVTASTTDSIRGLFKWFRSPDDQTANNETRKIFRDAINEMFGGDSKIPDSVRDAMRMADYGKGKPLTARRILIVKEAIDTAISAAKSEMSAAIAQAKDVAKDSASIVFSHVPRDRKAEVDGLIDMAIGRCGGDKDALEIISKCMGSFLLRGDCKLRSADAAMEKVDGVLANLDEMRQAANGNRAVLAASKDFLIAMNGKSLPPGQLAKVMQMVADTDTSSVGLLKPGASAEQIDAALSRLGKMTNELMIKSGTDKATEGSDEKYCLRGLIACLVIAKIGPSGARNIRQALMSETAQKLLAFYNMVVQDDINLGNLSPGHKDYTNLTAHFACKMLDSMKFTVDHSLGMKCTEVESYAGEFDIAKINSSNILNRITSDAKEMMLSKRDEKIAKYVNGDGPGAQEMRTLFANMMGPEPHTGRDADLEHIQARDFMNAATLTIASECKKCVAGDFKNTVFARDVVQNMNVTFPDGSKMSNDFETARDQIASFVTGGAAAKYDDLDATGKGKANIVMALLSQETVKGAYDSHAHMLNPKCNTLQYDTVSDPGTEKKEFNLHFGMDGDLYIKFTGEKQLQQMTARVPEANEHGQTVYSSKKIAVNPGSTIGAGFALTIKADEFEDMAKLDYSKFDDNKAREILDSKDDLFDKLNQAVDSIDPSFRLNKNAVFAAMKFSAEFV